MAVTDIKISVPSNVPHGVAIVNKILFSQNQILQHNLSDWYNLSQVVIKLFSYKRIWKKVRNLYSFIPLYRS